MQKQKAKFGILGTLVGVMISITTLIIQFLLFYWILRAYGTALNGFIRMSMSMSIIAGTAEGALGISVIIMMMKPIMEQDWITANEIYSTARRRYAFRLPRNLVFIALLSILYPLQVVIFPHLFGGMEGIQWGIPVISNGQQTLVPFWQLSILFLVIGFKQLITATYYGIYENILQADQKNGVKRLVILFSDSIVYGSIFMLLNYSINVQFISPLIIFSLLLIYPFIRGYLIKLYVIRHYTWLNYYRDVNNFELIRRSSKLFWTNIGQNIIMNADLAIIMILLGTFGLKLTSMLSLYMIVAVNVRLLLITLITSFREYFLSILIKEGRLKWEVYSNYELYSFIVAAFSFIAITLLTPYIATGFFGSAIVDDLNNQWELTLNMGPEPMIAAQDMIKAEASSYKFIFNSHTFSILFGLSTTMIILFQSQITLIQSKGIGSAITKPINAIAGIYIFVTTLITFMLYLFLKPDDMSAKYIDIVTAFYIIKSIFSMVLYIFLSIFTWNRIVYNASLKNMGQNLLSLVTPIIVTIILAIFLVPMIAPINSDWNGTEFYQTPVTVGLILSVFIVTSALGLAASLVLPLIFRPNVALRILINLPIVKNIVELQKSETKAKRYLNEGIDSRAEQKREEMIFKALNGFEEQSKILTKDEFNDKYKYKDKPKIFVIRGSTKEIEEK